MKYLIFILILGVTEVSLIGVLHSVLGTTYLITFYLATTLVGALLAWTAVGNFRSHKSNSKLSNKFEKRAREGRSSEQDILKMRSALYCTIYIIACVLIAIPGILTDILGLLLAIPQITEKLSTKYAGRGVEVYSNS